MVSWIWILMAFVGGGIIGFIAMAIFAAWQIAELKHWNRRLQKERDEAKTNLAGLINKEV